MPANLKATIDNFISSLQESKFSRDAPSALHSKRIVAAMLKIGNQFPISMRTSSIKAPRKQMPL